MTSHYQFATLENPAVEYIADKWQQLALRSEQDFFLQWPWIGSWLETFKPTRYFLVEANLGQTLVGLAVLVEHIEWRHGFIRSKQLCLHRTGIAASDEIWIEYNDFLLDKHHATSVRSQMFRYICDNLAFDELVIGASASQVIDALDKCTVLKRVDIWQANSYQVKFHDAANDPFDAYLSANSRYQIKRSRKNYAECKFEVAKDMHSVTAWMTDISLLHKQRWPKSGFRLELFRKFHMQLLEECINDGRVELIKITLAPSTRVYLYNFISGKTVYFYLSAMTGETLEEAVSNKLKPGLVAHFLAIEYYKKLGFEVYDFMGGDARYKASFSNKISGLIIAKFQRTTVLLGIENLLKMVKFKIVQLARNGQFDGKSL